MITVQTNLDALNKTLAEYQKVSSLTTEQALAKKGFDLIFGVPGEFTGLAERLRRLAPGRGSVRQDRIAALKAGDGIRVRPSIMRKVLEKQGAAVNIVDRLRHTGGSSRKNASQSGAGLRGVRFRFNRKNKQGRATDAKGRNLWAQIVKREIGARESGRTYTGFGVSIRTRGIHVTKLQKHLGRLNQQLAKAGLSSSKEGGTLRFTFGTPSVDLAQSLQKPKAQRAIAASLDALRADMRVYIRRKHAEAMQGAIKSAVAKAKKL